MFLTSRMKRVAATALSVAVIGSLAYATPTINRNIPTLLSGVDASGNLDDFDLAGAGEAIVVGNTQSDILVMTARGSVTNNSNGARSFSNIGAQVFNPATGGFETATSDSFSVNAQGQARLTAVYNPAFAD